MSVAETVKRWLPGVQAAPKPEIQVCPEPAPVPPPVQAPPPPEPHESLFPRGNVSPVLPCTADDEAIALMLEARGDRMETELVAAIVWIDSRIRQTAKSVESGGSVASAVKLVSDLASRRNVYRARLDAVRAFLGRECDPEPSLVLPDLVRLLPDGDVKARLDAALRSARAELADVSAEISDIRALAGDDDAYRRAGTPPGNRFQELSAVALNAIRQITTMEHMISGVVLSPWTKAERELAAAQIPRLAHHERGPQDNLLERLSSLLSRKRSLDARIASLEGDSTATAKAVGAKVAQAITVAGGRRAAIGSIQAAELLSGKLPSSLAPLQAAAKRAEAERDKVAKDLEPLTAVGITAGPAVDDLTGLKAEADAKLKAAWKDLAEAHKAEAEQLIERALSGDETARAALERLATTFGRAFPSGFAEAIAAAKIERLALAELAAVVAA